MKKSASLNDRMPQEERPDVLPLKGEIDLHVSPAITASLEKMIEKKPARLVVDLSEVSYIDSAGLAALISAMQKWKVMAAGLRWLVCRKLCVQFLKSRGSTRCSRFFPTSMKRWQPSARSSEAEENFLIAAH